MKLLILLLSLAACTRPTINQKYHRKDWKHWTDVDRDCLNTRNEILKARSLGPVRLNKRGCKVLRGKWQDYYYPQTYTNPKVIDIDHVVPLKHAHESGANAWSRKEKELFANDQENLVITNRSYNRKKGAKGIDQWLPVHESYACKYINDWIKIKRKYRLEIRAEERKTIAEARCKEAAL